MLMNLVQLELIIGHPCGLKIADTMIIGSSFHHQITRMVYYSFGCEVYKLIGVIEVIYVMKHYQIVDDVGTF